MQLYEDLSKGQKRLVWVGFAAYLAWMFLFHGWDNIIDRFIKPITNNDWIDLGIMFLLYWLIVFAILWVAEGFD
ncbi:hypothetical protein EOD41_04710 [Mucilaginibacter limnophilus]|uniref:Uncharacterized protein n=1 Tax=Mucilaginibacter limnophilus TaxID=1932778 RepID=A0A3S2UMD7_9SPHI|nr:hypothetical protein [Mucilaginibacter limnophilus]RVU01272.1 hypothetical protein EOD41_04710 [Mucilaginibacter limnophilus]